MFVDLHCDTLTKIIDLKTDLYKNVCHLDLTRLKNLGKNGCVQFFAVFFDAYIYSTQLQKKVFQVIDNFYKQLDKYNDDIMLCCNYNDIEQAVINKKVAAVLSIEGGEVLQGDISTLRILYRLGVRSLCLTWNYRNEIADGVAESITGGGLTSFGRTLILEMNNLGMLIDLSHISDKGFWDVIELTSAPILVSHSNSKKICNHRRNLTDEQILAVKNNGGVIGLNMCPEFLNNSGNAGIDDIIKHIENIVSVCGVDHIALGADFDGIDDTPNQINGIEDMNKLFNHLLKLNYPEIFIRKLSGDNAIRVIRNVLK